MFKAIIIHGNGASTPNDNWIPYLKENLENLGVNVLAPQFPEAMLAPQSVWLPYLESLNPDENTILIGHSSGAILAMRYAEKHKLLGTVIVGGYHSHLNIESEKQSGYFDTPWQWDRIRSNQKWIIQFSAPNDPWIPLEEALFLKEKLKPEYHELNQGHFGGDYYKPTFPELLESIKVKISM